MNTESKRRPRDIFGGDEVLRSCKWLLDDIQRKFEQLIQEGQNAGGEVSDDFRRRAAGLVAEFDLIWAEWRTRALGRGANPAALFEMEVSVDALRRLL